MLDINAIACLGSRWLFPHIMSTLIVISAAETLIKYLTTENKRLCDDIDELRKEVVSSRYITFQDSVCLIFQAYCNHCLVWL